MATEYALGLGWALWLGVFTSINPCPLATNIAAISYIGRGISDSRRVLLAGLLYALGRTLVYLTLGVLLVESLLASNQVSSFLRGFVNELLGPILVVIAMFLLGLIEVGISGPGMSEKMRKRADAPGICGSLLLGIAFAMAFCPTSAALFLKLVQDSTVLRSPVAMPSLFGLGTALPVVVFALILAFSAKSLGTAFNRLTQIEWWLRLVTGVIFLLLGIYFTLIHIFDLTISREGPLLHLSIRLWP
jgi:cytochrome c biogenesis protein CcdA